MTLVGAGCGHLGTEAKDICQQAGPVPEAELQAIQKISEKLVRILLSLPAERESHHVPHHSALSCVRRVEEGRLDSSLSTSARAQMLGGMFSRNLTNASKL